MPNKHRHRLQFSRTEAMSWSVWYANDRCGYAFYSSAETGGLTFWDRRPKTGGQHWTLAGADRFPKAESLDQFKAQLRAYFILWGGREGPNIPEARRQRRG